MSWKLTLSVAVAMLLISSVVRVLTKAARDLGEKVTLANSELSHRMVEGIDGMRVIRALRFTSRTVSIRPQIGCGA